MFNFFKFLNDNENKIAIIVFIMSGFYILPFINANLFYVDDLSRATTGYVGWGILGRPLSDSVMLFMSFSDFRLTDVSPLPIIISALVLSMTIIYCAKTQTGELTLASAALFSPILLNPFFLQNLSYRYDNLPMSLGVALSALAFVMCRANSKRYLVASFAMLVSSLCLYQTSINVFIGMIALGIVMDYTYHEPIKAIKNFIVKSLIFISSYAFYVVIVSPVYLKTNRSETISFNEEGFNVVRSNLHSCKEVFKLLITNETIKYITPIIVISLISLLFLILRRTHHKNKLVTFASVILLISSPVIAVASITGPLFLLKNFGFVPRVMTGFAGTVVYFLFLFYVALKYLKNTKNILGALKIYMTVPVLFSFSLCYTYVNAARGQLEMETSVIESAFNQMINNKEIMNSKVMALGETSTSDLFKVSAFKFPLINSLYKKSYDWTIFMKLESLGMDNMYFTFKRDESQKMRLLACQDNEGYVLDNPIYSVKKHSGDYILWFKNNKTPMCR